MLGTGLCVALLDWASKAAVAASVSLGSLVEVLPGSVAFWHVRNEAMMLGLYGDHPLGVRKAIAAGAAIAAVGLIAQVMASGHRLPERQRPWAWTFVGLMLGGMLGNLGERLLHWWVTDFLSFRWGGEWSPPGNVADLALLAAVPLAVVVCVLEVMCRMRRRTAPVAARLPEA